jgi:hypothetical protein
MSCQPLLTFTVVNLQILIDKEQILLRENTLLAQGGRGETIDKNQCSINKQMDFLVCPSCFWCATHFNFSSTSSIIRCPLCHNNRIDHLPLSIDKV